MLDIASITWPDTFAYHLDIPTEWQPLGDGSYRFIGMYGVLISTYAGTGLGWAEGSGLTWKTTAASYDSFTIQSGYTVMSWRVGPQWEQVAGGWRITGTHVRWYWWHTPPDVLEAGGPPITAQGEVALPVVDAVLRVRRAGQSAVGEYADAAGTWHELFTSGPLTDFVTSPSGWYVYAYDIYEGVFNYIRGFRGGGSTLYQEEPDGTLQLVGVDGRPIGVVLPDGTIRVWPGADQPLYQCQPDGTLAKVIS